MAILTKGTTFSDGSQVTSTGLNNLVDAAAFVAGNGGTTDDATLQVNANGELEVKTIQTGNIAAGAVTTAKIADSNVTTAKVENGAITPAKLSAGGPNWDGTTTSVSRVLELGANLTSSAESYIDFHSVYPLTDFEARIIRSAGADGTFVIANTGTGSLILNSVGNAPITFQTNGGNERMRLDGSGNLNIGRTTALSVGQGSDDGMTVYSAPTSSGVFQASNDNNPVAYFRRRSSNGLALIFYRDTTAVGSISVTATATQYNTSSDHRLKENVRPIENAIDCVLKLKPVKYNWKVDGSEGEGFIAHELQEVFPSAVSGTKDEVDERGNPVYQGVDTKFLISTLVKAIQEQQETIQNLLGRIQLLENK